MRALRPASTVYKVKATAELGSAAMHRLNDARILMYSHDTFGLGHLRRCRTIAHALVDRYKGLGVLIISGSQIAGAFDFKARVDFVKIPSVIKLYSGEYTSISEHIDIGDTLAMREELILQTAKLFHPDIFIADKEPLGLRGEIGPALAALKAEGCCNVLGLRDVMDSPELLAEEWTRKETLGSMSGLYDDIWIYGSKPFWNPLQGLEVPQDVQDLTRYMGFLPRETPAADNVENLQLPDDYILVTAGGGGDGADLMSTVLAAREHDATFGTHLLLVPGPFMGSEERGEVHRRASTLDGVTVIDFDNAMESLIANATAVVGMCGYNTFCEIMSFDKPALFVPRTHPREEQLIRASRAHEVGIATMLDADRAADPTTMAAALRALTGQNKPSASEFEVDFSGLDAICDRVGEILVGQTDEREERVAETTRVEPAALEAVPN
ncbi:MAG: glycosyltransferase [Pseudomonadota bacterium]